MVCDSARGFVIIDVVASHMCMGVLIIVHFVSGAADQSCVVEVQANRLSILDNPPTTQELCGLRCSHTEVR